jgi:hypothetical protein
MADDIFPGKYISAADVAKKMEDRIARGGCRSKYRSK